jgi:hypothetical protein
MNLMPQAYAFSNWPKNVPLRLDAFCETLKITLRTADKSSVVSGIAEQRGEYRPTQVGRLLGGGHKRVSFIYIDRSYRS